MVAGSNAGGNVNRHLAVLRTAGSYRRSACEMGVKEVERLGSEVSGGGTEVQTKGAATFAPTEAAFLKSSGF